MTRPVINASALPTGNLRGAEHGATISVILDHSEPGEALGCTDTPRAPPVAHGLQPRQPHV
jgi:hypothetical protein